MDLLKLPRAIVGRVLDIAIGIITPLTSRLTKPVRDRVEIWVPKFKSTAISVIFLVTVLLILLWLSILLYWSFYYSYVPAVSHIRDVNLIFGAGCDDQRGLCSFPAANMSLVTSAQQPILARGQRYKVNLEFDMPESPVNRDLGMFIVRLDFYTKYGEVVRTARRSVSAMLSYKSTLLRIAETVFFLPMYLLGYYNQKQYVEVQLYNTFTEDPQAAKKRGIRKSSQNDTVANSTQVPKEFKPTLGAYLEVQSRFIEIYKATLKIEAQFSGLRYILFTWPLTSAVIGVGIFMFFFTLVAFLSWYNIFWSDETIMDESGGVKVKYFTGAVNEHGQGPETIGGLDEQGEFEEKDQKNVEAVGDLEGPLAVQIRRRKLPES